MSALVNLQPGHAYHIDIRRRYEYIDVNTHRRVIVKPPDGFHIRKTLNDRIRAMDLQDELEAMWVGRRLLLIRKKPPQVKIDLEGDDPHVTSAEIPLSNCQ